MAPVKVQRPILLVEDDLAIRESISECLEGEGYAVASAAHGEEALAWLARSPRPALVMVDLVMPVMNGAELVARLRAAPATRDLAVILMTAAVTGPASPVRLPPVQAVLAKPFDLDQLLETVERLATDGDGAGEAAP